MKEIEIETEKTLGRLIDELDLTANPALLGVNGQIINPFEQKDRKLKKGDKVLVVPVFEGG
jgi:thiamine biosynthesis protein ThiS